MFVILRRRQRGNSSRCDWCLQHSDGKKWYLNIRDYQKDMYDEAVREAANAYVINIERITGTQSLKNWLNITNDEKRTLILLPSVFFERFAYHLIWCSLSSGYVWNHVFPDLSIKRTYTTSLKNKVYTKIN